MPTDPSVPLLRLSEMPGTDHDAAWQNNARRACQESLTQIKAVLDTATDRDTRVCLLAIARSLQWVLSEGTTPAEMATTIRRTRQIFDRMTATGFEWLSGTTSRELEHFA